MNDSQGRKYADLTEVTIGSKVEADDGFNCITEGSVLTVEGDEKGLFIPCTAGHHYIDGQLSEDGTHYIGLYHV